MPTNRNALIRYRTIDNCLRNRYRQWTLDDLVEACSNALYEYEGIAKGISTRTVQLDIQMMRSEKLGYNAPIMVIDKKYYTYSDPAYSITNIPLNENDLDTLSEVVSILKQFKGFTHFEELGGMINKLEDKIYRAKTNNNPVIDFEKNENLLGLEHLNSIYQAIIKKSVLEVTYQSFKARQPGKLIINPYLLKEYRSRWFLLGIRKKQTNILTLALDRIASIKELPEITFDENVGYDFNTYFEDIIGVTKMGFHPQEIIFFVDRSNAPYVVTKPIHSSQQIVEENAQGITFSINVIPNFELEKEFLAFGERLRIISPENLRNKMMHRLRKALEGYFSDAEIELTSKRSSEQETHAGTSRQL